MTTPASSLIECGYRPHRPDTWTARFAELKCEVEAERYAGRWDDDGPVMVSYVLPAGTTVKVVMVSRFGDVGITDDLGADQGYVARVMPAELLNLRESA